MKKIATILKFAVVCCLCAEPNLLAAANKKVIVLGIDGMDPKLLQTFVDEGRMPNFKALMREGDFRPLQTTMPAQSAVAWSTFMTGMDPGGHGIFDFIHVDQSKMAPYSSMAKANPSGHAIQIGSWSFPTSGGGVQMLRKGKTFWQTLGDHGFRSTIFRMPVNFPPVKAAGHALAGISEGAKKAGCDAFVTKPCLPEDLVKEIRRVLEDSRSPKKTRRSGKYAKTTG